MDNFRRPNPRRREYSLPRPNYAPPATPVQPAPAPVNPIPTPISPAPYPAAAAPQEVTRTPYQPPAPQPAPPAKPKSKIVHFFPYKYAAIGLAVLLVLGVAGYFLTRPAKKAGFTAAELAKKSTFSFYYPQPAPGGYSYVTEQNAFQDGQAYFMIGKGGKHIVFHEQAARNSDLNASSLSKPLTIDTPAGKAVIGTVAGQPAAKVMAGSTLISVNTTGGVSQDEITTAVQALKTTE